MYKNAIMIISIMVIDRNHNNTNIARQIKNPLEDKWA